ncbi:MAG: zf-HC2 domain-containing protein [Candidatus Sulfotelmatobacter sp.]
MAMDTWTEKIDAYLDGELPDADARALSEHLRECAACAAASLSRLQQKLAVRAAGQRFTPSAAFRSSVQNSIAARQPARWKRLWIPALATAAVLLIAGAVSLSINRGRSRELQLMSELADLHVATLASSNPVDVISTDRHTVKPWFAGKIPFTFNLPELQDSPFTLLGGKVSYLHQSPGAELLFRVRQHQISVFIFQEQALRGQELGNAHPADVEQTALSFNVRSWSHNGLDYFAISDASSQDLDKLSELIKAAG